MLDSSIVSRDLFSVQALLVGIALHTLAGCGAGDGVATAQAEQRLEFFLETTQVKQGSAG
jgi:hypothetical protein